MNQGGFRSNRCTLDQIMALHDRLPLLVKEIMPNPEAKPLSLTNRIIQQNKLLAIVEQLTISSRNSLSSKTIFTTAIQRMQKEQQEQAQPKLDSKYNGCLKLQCKPGKMCALFEWCTKLPISHQSIGRHRARNNSLRRIFLWIAKQYPAGSIDNCSACSASNITNSHVATCGQIANKLRQCLPADISQHIIDDRFAVECTLTYMSKIEKDPEKDRLLEHLAMAEVVSRLHP